MTDPYRELKWGDEKRIKREKGNSNLFLFKSLPEGLQMTLLTTVEILTPLSVMAPRDGKGFADLPEKLKAPRIFS